MGQGESKIPRAPPSVTGPSRIPDECAVPCRGTAPYTSTGGSGALDPGSALFDVRCLRAWAGPADDAFSETRNELISQIPRKNFRGRAAPIEHIAQRQAVAVPPP